VQKKSALADEKALREHGKMHHIKPSIRKPDGKHRIGKGFSVEELKKAGLNKADAKRLEIRVDPRRKTAHDANISELKTFAEQKAKAKAVPKPKPIEQEKGKKKPKK
jgi:large subunit ribosomal protein L13e